MVPSLPDGSLDAISRALGDAMIGSDITRVFGACGITDVSGESTKWKRLYYTFASLQGSDKCGNKVIVFIESALSPARWSSRSEEYARIREAVNRSLLFAGIKIGPNGKAVAVKAASTLDEASERANRLRAKLAQRSVHPEVLKSCSNLLLKDTNYFHAVFEVTKGVMDRLRAMASSKSDGNMLIDETLECGKRPFPIVALNRYDSPSLQNEQKGIAHLARGLVHAFRNVTSHEPQTTWTIPEEDALDMMAVASLIHRRLDNAVVTSAFQPATV